MKSIIQNLTITFFISQFIGATIFNVPDDYYTIQEGIFASVNGDTVLVAPGIYLENISFGGKNIVMISSGSMENTIIDGNNLWCTVRFSGNETNEAVLNGFTIQNGDDCVFSQGGGIYIDHSSPTLQNLIIRNNHAFIGGGIFINMNSHPIFENLLIMNNNGVGIHIISNSASMQLINCTITGNSEGGISIESASAGVVNTVLWDNGQEEINNWSGSVNIFYSDIQGGWEGEGNIDSDPLFTDSENGDYTLQEDSPCIDAGADFFMWVSDTLVDMSQDEYVGEAPDMGAFEWGPHGDVNTDGAVNILDILLTVNIILMGEYNNLADLNNDDTMNVQDIILIVNIILN